MRPPVINVLIVACVAPTEPAVLEHAVGQLVARGARVDLACYFDADESPVAMDGPGTVHYFGPTADPERRLWREARKRRSLAGRAWVYAGNDAWLRRRARAARVLVALDAGAIHTVWQLAQRNRRAAARFGLVPALRAVEERAARPTAHAVRDVLRSGPSWSVVRAAVRRRVARVHQQATAATRGRVVLGNPAGVWAWRRLTPVDRLPGERVTTLAAELHQQLVRLDRLGAAARLDTAWAYRVADPHVAAELLTRAAKTDLQAGREPAGFEEAITANVALADAAHRAGDARAVGASLGQAMALAFHRGLHFDVLSSPLTSDPERFLAPLRRSTALAAVAAPRGRARRPAGPPPGRPLRLLFVTRENDYFLNKIVNHYAAEPGVDVRFLDVHADPVGRKLTGSASSMIEDVLTPQPTEYGAALDAWLTPHLAWADTIFVDWCMAPAMMFTLRDPGTTRIIVRLHSFEAFSLWPQIIDFTRIDDLVFVSNHLRDHTMDVVPRLRGPDAPRCWVISNAMDLAGYRKPKPDDARFTLGMVGLSSVAKDPRWALEVARLVHSRDHRYRMLLIGDLIDPATSGAAASYRRLLDADVARLTRAGIVRQYGQTDDVAAALTEVGVIVSSSVRESFHCGLIEGAASGAVPVVRDWPFFAGKKNGARTLLPERWVVDSPQAAAERVLAVTASDERWREFGEAASEHAVSTWDWPVVRRQFDRLFGGPVSPAGSP